MSQGQTDLRNKDSIALILLVLHVVVLLGGVVSSSVYAAPELPTELEATVNGYLAGDANYRAGDLITRSQIEELQLYLRRTQGSSLATHMRWRSRMLADRAPLVQIFYAGGEPLLRKAAAKLGGYAKLDQLARSVKGRKILQQAVKNQSLEELEQALAAEEVKRAAKEPKEGKKRLTKPSNLIYTSQEFLAALRAEPLKQAARASKKATAQP